MGIERNGELCGRLKLKNDDRYPGGVCVISN